MSEALRTVELPAAAIAVIKEGAPKSRASANTLAAAASDGSAQAEPLSKATVERLAASASLRGDGEIDCSSTATPPNTRKPRVARDGEPEQATLSASASMTVRLPSHIPPKLLRVATDRKIAKQRPFTQQEIVAEALAEWLKKHGY